MWYTRWTSYWLPALVSTGKIPPSIEFKSNVTKLSDGFRKFFYDFRKRSNFSNSYIKTLLSRKIKPEVSLEDLKKSIIAGHNGAVFFSAFYYYFSTTGYTYTEENELIEKYRHSSFTFKDFLEHVIWSFELGIDDRHWARYHDLCGTCHYEYFYILHLNNMGKEGPDFFREVGYPKGINFASKHRVKEVIGDNEVHRHIPKNNVYDYNMELYKDIPKIIIDKLKRIYLIDLISFGFSIP